MMQPRRTPPESMPVIGRAFPADRAHAPQLGEETRQRLTRHIEWAMSGRTDWQDHLRVTVRVAAAEMRLAGVSHNEIERTFRRAVEDHPARTKYDAESLLTRELRSSQLVTLMLRWANGLRALRRW